MSIRNGYLHMGRRGSWAVLSPVSCMEYYRKAATWAGLVWTEIVRPTLAADCSVPEQPRRDIGSCFLDEFRFLVAFVFPLPMLVHDFI